MNVQIDPMRLEKFNAAKLVTGSHALATEGVGCGMNWGNYLAGGDGATDDHPCVSRSIRRAIIRLNDRWGEADRQLLKPLILRSLGTAGTPAQEQRRLWMLADFAARVAAPIAFDAIGAPAWAALLRDGPGVVDAASAGEMESLCRFAAAAAYAADAYDDAYDAAAAYAADAYDAYAADVADAAADVADVAYDAYAAAAADVADAARKALRDGWLALLDRMIRVTEDVAV